VYLLFCLREGRQYRLHFELFSDCIQLSRGRRKEDLEVLAKRYANCLENYCLKAPLQWMNFYDFWAVPVAIESSRSGGG
jgi:predicted LPLAT superfamily acyltransferase